MYTIYDPHPGPEVPLPNPFWILSVDPGITNVGFRVERRYWRGRRQLVRIETVWMEVLDFSADSFPETLVKMQNFLALTLCFVHLLSLIIIEEQLSKQNPLVSRAGQHWLSFYLSACREAPLRPKIYEFHSQAAKRIFGIERGLGSQVKSAIHAIGERIIAAGRDKKGQKKLAEYRKTYQYHLTDAIVQAEAVCLQEGYPCCQLTNGTV